MKSRSWVWVAVVGLAVGTVCFVVGRASSGVMRVSGSEFLDYARQIGMPQSVFGAEFIGFTGTRVYIEYWKGIQFLGPQYTVIWTPLSELPPDIAQKLRDGKNPWEKR